MHVWILRSSSEKSDGAVLFCWGGDRVFMAVDLCSFSCLIQVEICRSLGCSNNG